MPELVTTAYQDQAASLQGTLAGLDNLREIAIGKFTEAGFPNTRHEDWRYSDIKQLRGQTYDAAQKPPSADIPAATCETSARLVLVNGYFDEELSDLSTLLQTISIKPLADHLMANSDSAADLHSGTDAVSALNTALMRDGLVFSIPAGVEIDAPIEIVHVMTGADNTAAHVRHIVKLDEGAKVTLLEQFVGDDSNYWFNSIVQAQIAERAELNHYRLQSEGLQAVHTARAIVSVNTGGTYNACNVSLGASLSRFEAQVSILSGETNATIDGVALAASRQSHDMLVHVDHQMPSSNSDQVFRTVADAQGKSSFQGKITVADGAQQTLADQSFKALLLDRTAEANAKPELEIFADDVKCSHGATIGELDDKAMFYLMSRGIDPTTARQMLVEAFTDDALARIDNETIADTFRERIRAWMMDHAPSADGTPANATPGKDAA